METYFGAWRSLFPWRAYAGGRRGAYITRAIHALPRVKPTIKTHSMSIEQTYHNVIGGWFSLGCIGPSFHSFVHLELLLT